MNKRGYFFILDAFLALGVLVVGIAILLSTYTWTPDIGQPSNIAEDIINFLANTKIEDFNNPYFGAGGSLVKSGLIEDIDKTLLQQLGEFYYNGNYGLAEYLITNVTKDLVPAQFNYEILVDDEIIFPPELTEQFNESRNSTLALYPSKRLSFGAVNNSLELFGPYEVEILAWQ